ncbi:MAG: DNA repair protein RecN [SAR324 cluster bacterium]|uniref:DNA repair protein RecN n=1 Tax=SAR324 cluster bacterium TaxID=2024889 RepID=A0A2A4T2V6_9DELT|nr:MAG: DNA repair protein RecN [SAR324 cluster bacterium]
MLERLFVQNLATVEKQIIEFPPGFTVLTGETGAGKSVLMKSLSLILGEKCSKDLIRVDSSFLSVEATFAIQENASVREILQALDIEDEGLLVIRRKVHRSGKNSIFINDHASNLNCLVQLGKQLIDLHGQHSQQTLLQSNTHINYLDAFAGLAEAVGKYQEGYQQLLHLKQQQEELLTSQAERARKVDFMRYQVDEIDSADFSLTEEKELQEEFILLGHGEQLLGALSPVAEWSSNEHSPLNMISLALHSLIDAVKIEPKLQAMADEIQGGLICLEEVVGDVKRYLDTLEINPQRLEWVNQRFAELDKLKRKHGATLEDVFAYRTQLQIDLDELEGIEENQDDLQREIGQLTQVLKEDARKISTQRQQKCGDFESLILNHLKDLGLERSKFFVHITPKEDLTSKGLDQVEFLISTNPGNPAKALGRVASGGELSRIMLAIKTTLTHNLSLGTMIFDEIDTGISGWVAEAVGIKLRSISHTSQVICITHSPQIAAQAPTHFKVEKIFQGESSKTLITPLQPEERVTEIARFLGGNDITITALSVAKEMLKTAG